MRWLGAALLCAAVVAALGGRAAAARPGGFASAAASRPVHSDSLGDLPLTVVPAQGRVVAGRLAVLLTGDGGWAAIDRQLADSIAAHGSPVIVLDSRAYFETQRTPDGAARDLTRILHHYLPSGDSAQIVLIGYSRGADVLPFLATRLPPTFARHVRLIALLGPARNANFKFHLVDLVTDRRRNSDLETVPEIERLRDVRLLCIYGTNEHDSACRAVDQPGATVLALPGGHHFDKKYGEIATRILAAAGE